MGARLNLPRPAFSPALGSCQWTWCGVSCMGLLIARGAGDIAITPGVAAPASPLARGEQPLQMLDDARRRAGDALDRPQHLRAGDRAHVESELRRLLQILRILVGGY